MEKEKSIVLYCFDKPALIYHILVHRLGCSKDKKVVLFVKSSFGSKILEMVKKLEKTGIIDEYYIVQLSYPDRDTDKISEQGIIKHFNSVFKSSGYTPDSFEHIYIVNDNFYGDIALYLNLIKKRYVWIETVKNKTKIFPHKRMPEGIREWIVKYKTLTPYAEFANACLLKSSDVSQDLLKDKGYTIFDMAGCIKKLSEDTLDKLAFCYGLDIAQYSKADIAKSTLVLENSYGYSALRRPTDFRFGANTPYMKSILGFSNELVTDNEICAKQASIMDRIAIDFYTDDSDLYYVKNHPDEPSLTESKVKYLYASNYLPFSSMPFELVGRLFKYKGLKFKSIVTYLHTIETFDSDNQIVLGQNYFYTWFYYCSIYASVLYAKKCGFESIYCSAVIKEQVEFLLEQIGYKAEVFLIDLNNIEDRSNIENSLIVSNYTDDYNKNINDVFRVLKPTNAICFLNVDLSEKFFDGELYPYFVPIKIKKMKHSDNTFNLQRDEVLWVYSANRLYRDSAIELAFERRLKYSGYSIKVEQGNLATAIESFVSESIKFKIKESLKTQNL